MVRFLIFLLLLSSCDERSSSPPKDQAVDAEPKTATNYERLRQYLYEADSVVLLSHHSPNMPIKNPKTGEYYKKSIPFIENGKINYVTSVQEQKQLNKKDIEELADILVVSAVDDGVRTTCFQPRNAVVAFHKSGMSCFDFCFDCYGFSSYGSFGSDLIMDSDKYAMLIAFYKKHGFKYELE